MLPRGIGLGVSRPFKRQRVIDVLCQQIQGHVASPRTSYCQLRSVGSVPLKPVMQ